MEKSRKMKLGVIGCGQRGMGILRDVLFKLDDVLVTAVCDEYQDRTNQAAEETEKKYGQAPFSTTNYSEVLNRKDLDAVYVATSWESHVEIAIEAMERNLPVAMEVGGAYSLESLWKLVHTWERTKSPFMLMENCCFGKEELLATSLVRHHVLGEVVHCHGIYGHYLAKEIAEGEQNRHYRLRNYLTRNCENYPTHELGPIARILGINRGNRMVSLVSVASKACGMEEYLRQNKETAPNLAGKKFAQGDIVNTIITCANGSTISITLDTTLPRNYSRDLTVRGTLGMYEQTYHHVHMMGDEEGFETAKYYQAHGNNATRYEEQYLPKVWRDITPEELASGHGGMDYIQFRTFVDCLKAGKPMPIDVYDAAAWMSITAISELSIASGGCPQGIPDFTDGKWVLRKVEDVVEI